MLPSRFSAIVQKPVPAFIRVVRLQSLEHSHHTCKEHSQAEEVHVQVVSEGRRRAAKNPNTRFKMPAWPLDKLPRNPKPKTPKFVTVEVVFLGAENK